MNVNEQRFTRLGLCFFEFKHLFRLEAFCIFHQKACSFVYFHPFTCRSRVFVRLDKVLGEKSGPGATGA